MRQNTTKGNGRTDERVQFFVTANGQLQMAWRDAFHLQILGRIARKLEDFGGEVLEHGGYVNSGWKAAFS